MSEEPAAEDSTFAAAGRGDRPAFSAALVRGLIGGAVVGSIAAMLVVGWFLLDSGADDPGPATTIEPGETVPPTLPGPPPDASETLLRIGNAEPGDITGLSAAGDSVVEWIDRERGQIISVDLAARTLAPEAVAEVRVADTGREWGLIDSVVFDDGRRFASWTQPGSGDFDNGNLVVGELVDGVATRLVWNAGRIASTGFAGSLDVRGGALIVAVGETAGWADERRTRGAIVALDPDGDVGQAPTVLSEGYVDPRAFVVIEDEDPAGEVWVWDRAGERDPDDPSRSDVERFGRADLSGRDGLVRSDEPRRLATSIAVLADGSLGVCGGDGQLRSYPIEPGSLGARSGLGASTPVMACSTGVAVLGDGSIVTIATIDGRETLQIRR